MNLFVAAYFYIYIFKRIKNKILVRTNPNPAQKKFERIPNPNVEPALEPAT